MWLICMIEIMMCSRHVPSSVTWIRQSRYFTSYHSSKQGSNQRSSKRQNTQYCSILNVKTRNCCRSTLTQYGVVLLYLLESVASNSPEQLCSKLRLRKGTQILERFHNKKKSSVAQTYTPNRHKGKKCE